MSNMHIRDAQIAKRKKKFQGSSPIDRYAVESMLHLSRSYIVFEIITNAEKVALFSLPATAAIFLRSLARLADILVVNRDTTSEGWKSDNFAES